MGRKKLTSGGFSDKQAVREKLSKEYDYELANESLTSNKKDHNKETKKR